MAGTLYIVATPIGNLEDITLRAINILKEVDLIAAEDTRHTLKLLNHLNISKSLTSYHEHNRFGKGRILIEELILGKNIALVSDAGTPGISDPGEELVKEALDNGIKVVPIPGAVAFINALIVSGQSTSRFAFEGFLPISKPRKRERLNEVKNDPRTLIYYEAPHKLLNTLKEMHDILGNRNITIVRELTKKYEEIFRTTILDSIENYKNNKPLGEFVLIIEGKSTIDEVKANQEISIPKRVNELIDQGIDKKDAIKMVAKEMGKGKREIYSAMLEE